mmetsp:Transcript_49180/g.96414  ORF Transcript_49180/g.96414 Transcript_49180/m.96414 type:complete len:990 (+) Transcript_49180:33-3002(+)
MFGDEEEEEDHTGKFAEKMWNGQRIRLPVTYREISKIRLGELGEKRATAYTWSSKQQGAATARRANSTPFSRSNALASTGPAGSRSKSALACVDYNNSNKELDNTQLKSATSSLRVLQSVERGNREQHDLRRLINGLQFQLANVKKDLYQVEHAHSDCDRTIALLKAEKVRLADANTVLESKTEEDLNLITDLKLKNAELATRAEDLHNESKAAVESLQGNLKAVLHVKKGLKTQVEEGNVMYRETADDLQRVIRRFDESEAKREQVIVQLRQVTKERNTLQALNEDLNQHVLNLSIKAGEENKRLQGEADRAGHKAATLHKELRSVKTELYAAQEHVVQFKQLAFEHESALKRVTDLQETTANQLSTLQATQKTLKKKLERSSDAADMAGRQLKAVQEELGKAVKKNRFLEQQGTNARAQADDKARKLSNQMFDLEAQAAKLREALHDAKSQLAKNEMVKTDLVEDFKAKQEDLTRFIRAKEEELGYAKRDAKELEVEVQNLTTSLHATQFELGGVKGNLSAMEAHVSEAKNDIQNKNKEIAALKLAADKVPALEEQLKQAKADLEFSEASFRAYKLQKDKSKEEQKPAPKPEPPSSESKSNDAKVVKALQGQLLTAKTKIKMLTEQAKHFQDQKTEIADLRNKLRMQKVDLLVEQSTNQDLKDNCPQCAALTKQLGEGSKALSAANKNLSEMTQKEANMRSKYAQAQTDVSRLLSEKEEALRRANEAEELREQVKQQDETIRELEYLKDTKVERVELRKTKRELHSVTQEKERVEMEKQVVDHQKTLLQKELVENDIASDYTKEMVVEMSGQVQSLRQQLATVQQQLAKAVKSNDKLTSTTVNEEELERAIVSANKLIASAGVDLGLTTETEDSGQGVVVKTVGNTGSAHAAGIRGTDTITNINGTRIRHARDMAAVMKRVKPGDRLVVRYTKGNGLEVTSEVAVPLKILDSPVDAATVKHLRAIADFSPQLLHEKEVVAILGLGGK